MANGGQMMDVFDPKGKKVSVPAANFSKALLSGYEAAIPVVSPEGVKGFVPSKRFRDAQARGFKLRAYAPKKQEGEGFESSLLQPLIGVKSLGEAGRNIKETAKMFGKGTFLGSQVDAERFWTGVSEFITQVGKGSAQQGLNILRMTTPLGTLVGGRPKLEEATALFGGQEFARASRQLGERNYGGAAGSAAAGTIEALAWLWPLKGKLRGVEAIAEEAHPVLEAMAHGGAKLPIGKRMPTTPGMLKGGNLAQMESIAGGSLGGGRIRARYLAAQDAAQRLYAEQAKMTAREAGAKLPRTMIGDAGRQTELVGKVMRESAAERFLRPVEKAMNEASATKPVIQAVTEYAAKELKSSELGSMLATDPNLQTAVKNTLQSLAELETLTPGGMARLRVKPGMEPRSYDAKTGRWVKDVSAEPYLTGTKVEAPFTAVVKGRSNILAWMREKNISNSGRRILGSIVKGLEEAAEKSATATGGEELAAMLREGNAKYRQGSAMEEWGRELRGVIEGEGATTVPGAKPLPRVLNANKLETILHELSETSPVLPGREQFPSRLAQAFPSRPRYQTLHEIAQLLAKGEGGTRLTASKFGLLRVLERFGAGATGAVGGALGYLWHHPFYGAAAGIAAFPAGMAMFARLMTTEKGARLALGFFKAARGTPSEMFLGMRIITLTQGEKIQ